MTNSDDHFESFGDHTKLKHIVLRAYLQTWASKLLQSASGRQLVHFVDAFAGEGQDGAGHPGSPLIALDVAQQVAGMAATGKLPTQAGLQYTGIEKSPARFARLEASTAAMRSSVRPEPRLHLGTIEDHLDAVIATGRGAPMLTFLDPFGLKGLNQKMYAQLLSGERDEIFVLFAHMGAARLHGVITKDTQDYYREYEAVRTNPGLFADFQAEDEQRTLEEARRKEAYLEATADGSRRVLTEALGPAWEELLGSARDEKELQQRFIEVFARLLIQAGASVVQVLPMRDEKGLPKYALVHATKSVHGVRAMKECISTALKHSALDETMRASICEDLLVDPEQIADQLAKMLAGKTVPWSNSEAPGSARRVALEHTGIFQFQCDELKAVLRGRKWTARVNRLEVVTFPT